MFTHPGTKLLFQGSEFGQSSEWNFEGSLDWHLLQYAPHKGVQELVKDLNILYKNEPALHEKQFSEEGFEWIDYGDSKNSVFTYIRKGNNENYNLVIACNMTPVPKEKYKLGVPRKGKLKEVFNSDLKTYFGSGQYSNKVKTTKTDPWHFRDQSIEIDIPPLGMVVFKYENKVTPKSKSIVKTKPKAKSTKKTKPKTK
tara:strand:+ start:18 stop:611 length:594 start_codon:yes stop_codon:yes gene_type:complete